MGRRRARRGRRAGRGARGVCAAAVVAAVVVPVAGVGHAAASASGPSARTAPHGATAETNRAAARAAAHAARTRGDERRAAALEAFAGPGRRLLAFDARGDGRVVEVHGDLERAERIAVLVPGADVTLANYDSGGRPGGAARALWHELRRQAPDARAAVVAWFGYDTPALASTDVLSTARAEAGARALRAFLTELGGISPRAETALLCHSYGAVVCGLTDPGTRTTDIALYGAPGTGGTTLRAGDGHRDGTGNGVRVWAGRGAGDWIAHVPHVPARLLGTGLGLGPDPYDDPAVGARRFDAGTGGHGDYLRPGSPALRNLARIALGRTAEVTRAVRG